MRRQMAFRFDNNDSHQNATATARARAKRAMVQLDGLFVVPRVVEMHMYGGREQYAGFLDI